MLGIPDRGCFSGCGTQQRKQKRGEPGNHLWKGGSLQLALAEKGAPLGVLCGVLGELRSEGERDFGGKVRATTGEGGMQELRDRVASHGRLS
jgi:hypothetical protein